jgi:hypothetical protein
MQMQMYMYMLICLYLCLYCYAGLCLYMYFNRLLFIYHFPTFIYRLLLNIIVFTYFILPFILFCSHSAPSHSAVVRGALRAEREDLLTVVLPQSMSKQTNESQELLDKVDDVITMPQNDDMSLDVASRICNSYILSLTDQLISFAFHESNTVVEASKEAKALDMLVTTLYLD